MRLLSFLFALLLLPVAGAAQQPFWLPSTGPYGGQANAMIVAGPGRILVGMENGLYLSTDDGRSWEIVAPFDRRTSITSLARSGSGAIFATTLLPGLWRSRDEGRTWTELATPEIWQHRIGADSNGVLYLSDYHDVHRSTDDGASWTSTGPGWLLSAFDNIVTLGPTLLLAHDRERVYRSTNAGMHWDTLLWEGITNVWDLTGTSDGSVFASVYSGRHTVYRTTDGGENWTRIDAGLSGAGAISIELDADGTPVAMSYLGLFRWNQERTLWEESGPPGNAISWAKLLAIGDRALLAYGDEGVFRSIDNGSTWDLSNVGLTSAMIWGMALAPNGDIYASHFYAIHRSTDMGRTWTRTAFDDLGSIVVTAEGTLVALSGDAAYRSTDEGTTWRRTSLSYLNGPSYLGLQIAPDGSIYASTAFNAPAIKRSTDDGMTWQPLPIDTTIAVGALAIDGNGDFYTADDEYRTADDGAVIRRSTDMGATWHPVVEMPYPQVSGIIPLDDGNLYIQSSFRGIYHYDAASGALTHLGPTDTTGYGPMLLDSSGTLYFGSNYSDGFYRRRRGASEWEPLESGLAAPPATLAIHPSGHLVLGTTGGSVQISSVTGLTVVEDPGEVQAIDVRIAGNELTAVVTFNEMTTASLELISTAGERIAIDPERPYPAGEQRITMPLDEISDGAYLLILRAGSDTATAKLLKK